MRAELGGRKKKKVKRTQKGEESVVFNKEIRSVVRGLGALRGPPRNEGEEKKKTNMGLGWGSGFLISRARHGQIEDGKKGKRKFRWRRSETG